jgi:hypothetical protein
MPLLGSLEMAKLNQWLNPVIDCKKPNRVGIFPTSPYGQKQIQFSKFYVSFSFRIWEAWKNPKPQ